MRANSNKVQGYNQISDMKKKYMKPSMMANELQHMTWLLVGSDEVRRLQSSGWNDPDDELDLSEEGGGSSIWDR